MDQSQNVDPDVFHEDGLGYALETLDTIFGQYDEEARLEVARESYHDLQRGIEEYSTMTCYTDRSLEDLKANLPGSVFSELFEDREPLTTDEGDFTLNLVFGQTQEETYPIETDYDNIEIHVPTQQSALKHLYLNWRERFADLSPVELYEADF